MATTPVRNFIYWCTVSTGEAFYVDKYVWSNNNVLYTARFIIML